jgi:hypothetical protein
MKIIIFDDEKNVKFVQEGIDQPITKGRSEVAWAGGGIAGITNYVILEDEMNFEDMTDEDIQNHFAEQEGYVPPENEMTLLKDELAMTQSVLNDFLLGGMAL